VAERRSPVRIRIGVPSECLGQRHTQMTAWLDEICGSNQRFNGHILNGRFLADLTTQPRMTVDGADRPIRRRWTNAGIALPVVGRPQTGAAQVGGERE
jgi:hypothetical protein